MKKQMLYLSILLFPFFGMVLINEFVRFNTVEAGYNKQGIVAINTAKKLERKCTWICHNNTDYCKEKHVKLAQPYFDKIDPFYFGIIKALQSTGKYGLANILFLVILFPLFLFFLLVKSISIQLEIYKIKKEQFRNE